ncbi:MAG TPA: FtsQ-type POTRA domain-containing protein [Pseudolysinimonas sp.]|nr:FtsQ-type POTRA domain-containing protein [Pseudolysinimonas sp.]
MKRPEGFDRAPEPSRSRPTPRAGKPERTAKPDKAARSEKAAKPDKPVSAPRHGPSAKSVRAELAAAERLRKREIRNEQRRFTRSSRRRRIAVLTIAALVVVMIALVATAVFSPLLALRDIRIEGVRQLDAAEVQKAVDGQMGTPLALLDEGRLRSELSKFRLIRSYTTELVPPDGLVIHIVERSAIGVVAAEDGFDTVDAAGVTVASSAQRPAGLPLMDLGSAKVTGSAFAAMSQVLLALPPSVAAQVDTVSARSRDDVTLVLAGSDQRVVWGGPEDSSCKATTLGLLVKLYSSSGAGAYDVSSCGHAVWRAD